MELKLMIGSPNLLVVVRSNRTFMELKYVRGRRGLASVRRF